MSGLNGHVKSEIITKPNLVQELYGGEIYEYYPLGPYIVAAPGVCGGRPTFKYTRLEASMVLSRLAAGDTVADILNKYSLSKISTEAIYEALQIARDAVLEMTKALRTKKTPNITLIHELYGGEIYEYYPLGQYVVAAPGVCGGRPTFKYTRLEISMILSLMATGDTVEVLLQDYRRSKISAEAIHEAILLARDALLESTKDLRTKSSQLLEFVGV